MMISFELALSIILLLLCVPVILHKKYVKKHEKHLKNVPGPKPNPFFGNMLDFAVPTHKFLNVISNYIDQYGSIVKVFDGPQSSILLVSDAKLMENILSSTKLIEKSNQYEYFHNWLGTGLLTSTGTKWKKHRRMLTPAFHFSILENFVDIFDSVGNIFVKKLKTHIGEKNFDIYPMVSLCALDVICEAAMGTSVNAQLDNESKYVKSIKEMCKVITKRNFSPLDTRLYPLTINYYLEKRALKVIHSHTDAVIDKRIEQLKYSNEKKDENDFGIRKKMAFLDLVLQSTIDGQPLSRVDIREEVDTFMFEGHDTTSSAISFALYNLANHPLVQQKVIEEQNELFGNQKNPKITITDFQNMKYLELVIKETLRLYPSVPLFGRNVTDDFEWEGSIIPRGQQVMLLPYISQRNAKYFPNPLKFIPERFIDIDGTEPYKYVPFSAGPRNCIGQKFAMLEMKSLISKVIRNFELLPASPAYELQLAPELILISKSGIRLSLKQRN